MTAQMETHTAIPAETLGDRMRRALRKEHLGVQDMADYLGVSRNTVSTWINDRIHPSEQTLKLWAIRTAVPEEWLKHGDAAPAPFPSRVSQGATAVTHQSAPRCHPAARTQRPRPTTWIDAVESYANQHATTRGI